MTRTPETLGWPRTQHLSAGLRAGGWHTQTSPRCTSGFSLCLSPPTEPLITYGGSTWPDCWGRALGSLESGKRFSCFNGVAFMFFFALICWSLASFRHSLTLSLSSTFYLEIMWLVRQEWLHYIALIIYGVYVTHWGLPSDKEWHIFGNNLKQIHNIERSVLVINFIFFFFLIFALFWSCSTFLNWKEVGNVNVSHQALYALDKKIEQYLCF